MKSLNPKALQPKIRQQIIEEENFKEEKNIQMSEKKEVRLEKVEKVKTNQLWTMSHAP
jgi:hypothetical protein